MRKVILSLAMSLDGYIAKPDGSVDWLQRVPNRDKTDHGFTQFYQTIDTTLMGRVTYEEILGFNIPFPFPDKTNYVFSRQQQRDTEFVKFVSTEISAFVQELKSQPGKDMWLVGGGELNTAFLNKGLIDELLIRVAPVVLGEGIPLFGQTPRETLFRLLQTETFPSGIVQLTYSTKTETTNAPNH